MKKNKNESVEFRRLEKSRNEVKISPPMQKGKKNLGEDMFWDEIELFCPSFNVTPSSPK